MLFSDVPHSLDTATIAGIETIAEATARIQAVMAAFAYENFTILDVRSVDGKPDARLILDDASPDHPMHLKDFGREERRHLFASILGASTPGRWRSVRAGPVTPIIASRHLFTECPQRYDTRSGIFFPVHSGLHHAGVVIFFGDGKPDLDILEVGALRLFCIAWYARLSTLTIDERAIARITARELECLQLAAEGMTSEAIAAALGLSRHTVTHHLVSATMKLNANTRTHAIAEAVRMGLIR